MMRARNQHKEGMVTMRAQKRHKLLLNLRKIAHNVIRALRARLPYKLTFIGESDIGDNHIIAVRIDGWQEPFASARPLHIAHNYYLLFYAMGRTSALKCTLASMLGHCDLVTISLRGDILLEVANLKSDAGCDAFVDNVVQYFNQLRGAPRALLETDYDAVITDIHEYIKTVSSEALGAPLDKCDYTVHFVGLPMKEQRRFHPLGAAAPDTVTVNYHTAYTVKISAMFYSSAHRDMARNGVLILVCCVHYDMDKKLLYIYTERPTRAARIYQLDERGDIQANASLRDLIYDYLKGCVRSHFGVAHGAAQSLTDAVAQVCASSQALTAVLGSAVASAHVLLWEHLLKSIAGVAGFVCVSNPQTINLMFTESSRQNPHIKYYSLSVKDNPFVYTTRIFYRSEVGVQSIRYPSEFALPEVVIDFNFMEDTMSAPNVFALVGFGIELRDKGGTVRARRELSHPITLRDVSALQNAIKIAIEVLCDELLNNIDFIVRVVARLDNACANFLRGGVY